MRRQPSAEAEATGAGARWRRRQLTKTLRDTYGHLGISGLHEVGHGLDARVYRYIDRTAALCRELAGAG